MKAGILNKQVTLQTESRSSDSAGGATVTWGDTATVWAAIDPKSALERFEAEQLNAKVSHVITIRYRSGVTSAMRVKYGSRTFNILAPVNPLEKNEELRLECEELIA